MTPYLIKTITRILPRSLKSQKSKAAGFSLVELLSVSVISVILISGLLLFMNNLLQSDRAEAARNETDQDMKNALDYMTQDLREAVYVYNGNDLTELTNYLPNFGTGTQPILAFWKVEKLPYSDTDTLPSCNTLSGGAKQNCDTLKVTRRSYTLVVYLQSTSVISPWKGKSRISRYQLRRYPEPLSTNSTLTETTGYVSPVSPTGFKTWPEDSDGVSLQTVVPSTDTTNPGVLVDFIDDPTNDPGNLADCDTDYTRSPNPDDTATSTSFYACVRNLNDDVALNQDVILYLRGNSKGKPGILVETPLQTLKTQVINYGVIDKVVSD